jgi:cobalt-zinc-cadmium efflux system outer membrane protein
MGFMNPAPCIAWIAVAILSAQARSGTDSLTLAQALERGRNHPSVEASALEARARKALASQAGAFANPRLSLEAENFAGTGPLSGTQALETTARLEQTVELGGKRSLRREQAEAEARLSEGNLASRGRDIAREIRARFGDILWRQEQSMLAARKTRILEDAVLLAQRRLEAGRGTVAEDLKMRLELERARLDASRAEGEAAAARTRLSVFLGAPAPDFNGAKGDFKRREPLPAWDSIRERISRHPDLARWKDEKEVREAARKLAGAENMPDLDFNAGFRQQREAGRGDFAWVGGVSIPLPLWNRNPGGRAGAAHRAAGAEKEEQAARREMLARARGLWDGLRMRALELDRLETGLIPDAEKANAAARSAYAAGRFSSLELLDGQRLLFELNEQYVEALAAWHRDAGELKALAGAAHPFEAKEAL